MAVETYLLSGWPLWSWISPSGAAFFLFVNVLIGAIVVTSSARGHQSGGQATAATSTRRLCRSASSMVLDRLRSFSMFPVSMEMEEYYGTSSPELEEAEEQQPQSAVPETEPPAAAAVAAPDADGASSERIAEEEAGAAADEGMAAAERQSQEEMLAETSMEMQRRRAPAVCRCRRDTEEALAEGKATLNARADSFIRRFREDLRLERLNSIINYTRTLRRGGSAAGAPPAAQ